MTRGRKERARARERTRRILALPVAAVTAGVPASALAYRGESTTGTRHHWAVDPTLGGRLAAWTAVRLPPGGSAPAPIGPAGDRSTVPRPAGPGEGTYTVVRGDSLTRIARHFGVDVRLLAARNALRMSRILKAGTSLVIPASRAPTYPPAVLAAAARDRAAMAALTRAPRSQVRRLVVQQAKEAGVPASLALAITAQESGFQQGVVSDADAIGAMQVLPSTAASLATTVLHRPLNLFDVRDNVLAGVTLLHQLLAAATVADAVAGYYQGLPGVRARGMDSDTRVYVADVLALQRGFG